jgi:hypothetical protein
MDLALTLAAPFDITLASSITFDNLSNLTFTVAMTITDDQVIASLTMDAPSPIQLPAIQGVYIDVI